jgi:hypothetical protein
MKEGRDMKLPVKACLWMIGVVLTPAILCTDAWAQARVAKPETPANAAAGPVARIREITGVGPRYVVKTPEYTTSVSRGKGTPRDWGELTVIYDTQQEWLDELTFQYYVLLFDKKKSDYSLFKGTVTFVDIPKGRNHLSTMYLRPVALARYGEVAAMAVEVVYKGEVAETKADERMIAGAKLAKEWWKSPQLTVKEGYILNRAQTPFAFVNYDDYETIK